MENPSFINEEDIPLINQDEDCDNYVTPDTSRADETSFTLADITETTSTLPLGQKLERDKVVSLYKHLNVMGNPDLTDLDKFRLTKDPKKEVTIFEF